MLKQGGAHHNCDTKIAHDNQHKRTHMTLLNYCSNVHAREPIANIVREVSH